MKLDQDQLLLITGGAGFIGSSVVRYLNQLGFDQLLLVDDLGKSEKWKNLVGKRFVDLISKQDLFNWLEGKEPLIEAIIHLGACSDTMETDADYLLNNNYRYSVKLAEYALKNEIRFIYASSAATYGNGLKGFHDGASPAIFELEPLNMYGFSKQLFDQWLLNQGAFDRVVGLKYFNVFGPNEGHKGRMASAITKMVPMILNGEKVRLFKSTDSEKYRDGEQRRDFIYVKDAVRMTCAFLNNQATGLFNIGSGIASTWNELAGSVYSALGKAPAIEYIEMPVELAPKYQNFSQADMQATSQALGREMTQCLPLKEAVEDYLKNYLMPGRLW
jgi:ADP-L-glycero-D-manno-heptose 6-epimerase